MNNQIDIGVSIPYRNSDFMEDIMASGIADSGLESNDVFYNDTTKQDTQMTDSEFDAFLDECGIGAERFKQW